MLNGLLIGIAMLLSIIGCGYYALSQSQHRKVVVTSSVLPLKQARLKLLSLLALSASLVLYIVEGGLEFAVILWPLSIGLGIFCIAMILAFRPTMLRILLGGGNKCFVILRKLSHLTIINYRGQNKVKSYAMPLVMHWVVKIVVVIFHVYAHL